jgi:hypothetical protein
MSASPFHPATGSPAVPETDAEAVARLQTRATEILEEWGGRFDLPTFSEGFELGWCRAFGGVFDLSEMSRRERTALMVASVEGLMALLKEGRP